MIVLANLIESVLRNENGIELLARVNTDILTGTAQEYLGEHIKFILKYHKTYNGYPSYEKIPDYEQVVGDVDDNPGWYFDTTLNETENIIVELARLQIAKGSTISPLANYDEIKQTTKELKKPVVFDEMVIESVTESFDEDRYYVDTGTVIPTGLPTFDAFFGGAKKGAMLAFAAKPNVGKTTTLTSLCSGYYQRGKRVLYATMEMSREEILNIIDAQLNGFNSKHFELSATKKECKDFLDDVIDDVIETHQSIEGNGGVLHILDCSFMSQIETQVLKMSDAGTPYDIVFCDNFYELKGEDGDKSWMKDLDNITRLKGIANGKIGETVGTISLIEKTVVILATQLKASEKESGGMESLAKTVGIAEKSNMVVFIEGMDGGILQHRVVKNRSGEKGVSWRVKVDYNESSYGEIKGSAFTPLVNSMCMIPQPKLANPSARGSVIK